MVIEGLEHLNRREDLEALAAQVKELSKYPKIITEANPKRSKWEWSNKFGDYFEDLRQVAIEHKKITRGPLDELLAWPNKELADPDLFYYGKHDTFDRHKDWFSTMGFTKHETQYSFTNTWDKAVLNLTFLVPNNIEAGASIPIMWYFHGGGLCTGASDHIPWYSRTSLEFAKRSQAIIIAVDYPLAPEANYEDICDAVRDFLHFYKEDGYFRSGPDDPEAHWTDWLLKKIYKEGVTLDKNRIVIDCESAGAYVAMVAIFLNADLRYGTRLPIRAVLLRYPMVSHYKRDFPADGSPLSYMGEEISREQAESQVAAVNEEIFMLEEMGLVPARTKGYAPEYMAGAFLLSTTKKWKTMLQRKHGPTAAEVQNPNVLYADNMDCLERARFMAKQVAHEFLPPIIMYHGHDDANCPISDTKIFKDLMIKYYPTRYVDKETINLWEVKELHGQPGLTKGRQMERWYSRKVGHGFDYDLDEETEPFLKDAYSKVSKFWMKD